MTSPFAAFLLTLDTLPRGLVPPFCQSTPSKLSGLLTSGLALHAPLAIERDRETVSGFVEYHERRGMRGMGNDGKEKIQRIFKVQDYGHQAVYGFVCSLCTVLRIAQSLLMVGCVSKSWVPVADPFVIALRHVQLQVTRISVALQI